MRLLCESMIIPIDKWTLVLKNGAKRSFSYATKASTHLSQQGECVYIAQSWKEKRLLCESLFIPIQRRTSILKMVKREVFPMKPKHRYHLSQWEECVYGA